MNIAKTFTKALFVLFLAIQIAAMTTGRSNAAEAAFTGGWALDQETSSLTFQSVKNGSVVETSTFATYHGGIDEAGNGFISVLLDSVDTKIDLRNVRMRFLFFETFKFPEAMITTRIDPAAIADLSTRRRVNLPLTFVMDLHGIKQTLQIETTVTLISDNEVSVASRSPLSIATGLFGLEEGVKKLEDAASVTIVPSGSVSFDFIFKRGGSAPVVAAVPAKPETAAVETAGDFSQEECAGRFEILSRTGAIYFSSGSAELDSESRPLLTAVINIIKRCPSLNIIVAGHTDARGGAALNQRLSEARANSVRNYLIANGIETGRIGAVGHGESNPVAPNDTERNMGRNRRIEFAVAN